MGVDDLTHGPLDLFFVRHIHAEGHRSGSGLGESACAFEINVGVDDLGAIGSERGANGLTDGTGGTGDEGHLILELDVHCLGND